MQDTSIDHPLFVVPEVIAIPVGVDLFFDESHLGLAAVGECGVVDGEGELRGVGERVTVGHQVPEEVGGTDFFP